MTAALKDAADVAAIVIWPATIVFALLLYRRQIPKLVEALGSRLSSVSAGAVTIELATAVPLAHTAEITISDLTKPAAAPIFGDERVSFKRLLLLRHRADYAIIDLAGGKSWLTSRLYLFGRLLPDVVGIQCFVFVQDDAGIARRFIGLAQPSAVAETLGKRFPWLEKAYVEALWRGDYVNIAYNTMYSLIQSSPESPYPTPLSVDPFAAAVRLGIMPIDWADDANVDQIVEGYFTNPQIRQASNNGVQPGWTRFEIEGSAEDEHGDWIIGEPQVTRIFEEQLSRACVVAEERSAGLVEACLAQTGRYVALVDRRERFVSLVDRLTLAELLAKTALRK